jgi:hypothetical protein
MNSKITLLLSTALLLAACGNVPTVPELYARDQWKGRGAAEVMDFFGTPGRMQPTPDKSQVVMQWYRDTTYVRNEQVGQSTEVQGGVRVNTQYWDNVEHPGSCIVSITVNKAKTVTDFDTQGRCNDVKFGPN